MDDKINIWLQTYDPINEIAQFEDIHHEELTETLKNLALQRTGIENMAMKYIGEKGWKKQYQYMLLLKSESEEDSLRLNNLNWLDDLIEWLELQNKTNNYPDLDDETKEIVNVDCANALTYQTSEDGAVSVYSLQLYFDVVKNDNKEISSI